MAAPEETVDVAIVGLGPVGAALGAMLARRGVSVCVAEKDGEIYPLPRAAHFDHEIMRLFQGLGIADAVLAHARPAPAYRFQNAAGEVLMHFDMPPGASPSGWSPSYMFHQPGVEEALRSLLTDVDVRLGRRFEGLVQDGDGVTVTLAGPGALETVRARYLVGCDGGASAVRKAIGVGLDDYGFDEPWLVIDTRVGEGARLPDINLQICDPERPTTCVLMGPGRHRWEFMLKPGEDPAAVMDDAVIAGWLAPWGGLEHLTLERKAVYRFHGLVAQAWRSGRVFLAGVSAAIMLRVWLPMASPAPIIDVFVQFQESAQNLLHGLNPYRVQVSDVYRGTENFGYTVFGYSYLPANLYLQTLGYALFGDIRYSYIAAELVAAASLYAAARRRGEEAIGRWLVLLFFFHPRGLFALEQAWTEPLIVGAYATVDWLAARRPGQPGSGALAAAYGAMLSLKQYLLYFILHGLILERRPRRLLIAALVAAATVVPFAIADRESLIRGGILFQLKTTFRPDGLTLSAALYSWTGLTVGKSAAAVVGLLVGGLTFVRFRPLGAEGWRFATVITTVAMFLVGSQAFCNYYYLVSAMLLFTLAGCGGEPSAVEVDADS